MQVDLAFMADGMGELVVDMDTAFWVEATEVLLVDVMGLMVEGMEEPLSIARLCSQSCVFGDWRVI